MHTHTHAQTQWLSAPLQRQRRLADVWKFALGIAKRGWGNGLCPLKQHHENCSHSRYSALNYCLFTLPSSKHLTPPHTTTASNPPSVLFCTSSLFPNSFSFYYTYLKTLAFMKWFKKLEGFRVSPKHKRMKAFVIWGVRGKLLRVCSNLVFSYQYIIHIDPLCGLVSLTQTHTLCCLHL